MSTTSLGSSHSYLALFAYSPIFVIVFPSTYHYTCSFRVPLYQSCIQFYVKQITTPSQVTVVNSRSFIEVDANICMDATIHEGLPIIKGAVLLVLLLSSELQVNSV